MDRILPLSLKLRNLTSLLLISVVAIVPAACSRSSLTAGTAAIAQNSTSSKANLLAQNNFSVSACQRDLQDRIAQETGNQVQVSIDSPETYFISNAEEGVRGIATSRSQTNNQSTSYRFDCAVNLQSGQVTRLTYNQPGTSPGDNGGTLTPDAAYNRGYNQGETDARNNQRYNPNQGLADNGIQDTPDLARAYTQGYDDGFRSREGVTTSQQAYDRGYQQGQSDARNNRQYNPTQGLNNAGIQDNPDLARSYTQGYGAGYKSNTLTSQQAYDRGYQQGQTDARNNRQYNPTQALGNAGIQNNSDLSRSYTQGYRAGYQSTTSLNPPSNSILQACTSQAQAQGLEVLSVTDITPTGTGQEATVQVRDNQATYTVICYQDNSGQISFYPAQPMPTPGQAQRPPAALW